MNRDRPSDVSLLAAACDGDPAAFRVLYERYAEQIRRYHLRRCRDEEAAYDLLAETFAEAWCVRGRFRDEAHGSVGPWLFGIAHNVLRRSVRARRLEDDARQRLGMLEQADRPGVTPDEGWLDGVDELLETLTTEQRAAVELRVIDELDYDRVGRRLSVTPATARQRVHRALDAMRRAHLMSGEVR